MDEGLDLDYHRQTKVKLETPRASCNDPCVVRHKAIHAISSILMGIVFDAVHKDNNATTSTKGTVANWQIDRSRMGSHFK
jgi:hypothetical protein